MHAIDAGSVEDVYPLAPIQQGMLYHMLSGARSGMYVEQTLCTLRGRIDFDAFRDAWQTLVDAHPILRTAFYWEGLDRPLQVVRIAAALPFACLDWREKPAEAQRAAYDEFLRADVAMGFDLQRPPLMRLTLIRVEDEVHWLVWSSYHLILDAWSLTVLLREVFCMYRARGAARASVMPRARPYGEYVRWLADLDTQAAERFWRGFLAGIAEPTLLDRLGVVKSAVVGEVAQASRELSPAESTKLRLLLRSRGFTLNSLMQALWTLLVHHRSGCDEIVFGSVVAGRPVALRDADTIVGPFLNTVPVRLRVHHDVRLDLWMEEVQQQQLRIAQHESVSLVDIRRWSDIPAGSALFDSILVVLNSVDLTREETGGLEIADVRALGHSNYTLALRVVPGDALRLEILYHTARIERAAVDRLLDAFSTLVRAASDDLTRRNAELLELLSARATEADAPKPDARAGFATVRPKPVRVFAQSLFKEELTGAGGGTIPLVGPAGETLDAVEWVRGNLDFIRMRLREKGGLVLRGFKLGSLDAFESLARALAPELMDYKERSTPRTRLAGKVYSSTEYPAQEAIALHNEFSYGLRWPMKICFYCVKAAGTGGETPVADGREVYRLLPSETRQRFTQRGVMYVRNYGGGVDLSWQDAFQTESREQVEAYCRRAQIQFEWTGADRLRTSQVRHAALRHPQTGDPLWFNQAHLFHISGLGAVVADSLLSTFGEGGLPRNAYHGDGSRISSADLDAIRSAYRHAEVVFPWQDEDLLVLDNMRMAHGRRPFSGERRVAVCMAEPSHIADHEVIRCA